MARKLTEQQLCAYGAQNGTQFSRLSDGKWKRFRMRLGNFADFIFGKMLLAWQLIIENKVGHAQLTNAEESTYSMVNICATASSQNCQLCLCAVANTTS